MEIPEKRGLKFFNFAKFKKAQTTIFIIIAIIIISGVLLAVFLSTGTKKTTQVPSTFETPYNSFLQCLENNAEQGVNFLGTYGGHIESTEFEPGSEFSPFSSHLYVSGISVPYWHYVSGNGIEKINIPSKNTMKTELEKYIEDKISDCDLNNYQEFSITLGQPTATAEILDNKVIVNLEQDFFIKKGTETSLIQNHNIKINSDLGELYDTALNIYKKEQNELFLENYGVDILRLYAPVDGVEFTCSPQVWNAENVFDELETAIEGNTLAIGSNEDYFSLDLNSNYGIRFINSRDWPNAFEVEPNQGPLLTALPVGNQPGLGILGFCYVPYHFLYDVKYPVLVQVYKENQIFQFPLAVIIDNNQPQTLSFESQTALQTSEICNNKNIPATISVIGENNRNVQSTIYYECAGTSCYIGESDQTLEALLPQCVNGKIIARSQGYEETEKTYTSLQEGNTQIVLDKIYPLEVDLSLDFRDYNGEALITFSSNKTTKSIFYPTQKIIELSQGKYDVEATFYDNVSFNLEPQTSQECVEVPKGGLGGLIGLKDKKCFDIEIPKQTISRSLVGGGTAQAYLLNSILQNSQKLKIDGESLPIPQSLEDIQTNYILFENKKLQLDFT